MHGIWIITQYAWVATHGMVGVAVTHGIERDWYPWNMGYHPWDDIPKGLDCNLGNSDSNPGDLDCILEDLDSSTGNFDCILGYLVASLADASKD